MIALALLFAALPRSGNFGIIGWIVGIVLFITCALVVAFEVVIGTKVLYLTIKGNRGRPDLDT